MVKNNYTGMESLPLEVVNTIYWLTVWTLDHNDIITVGDLALDEIHRRFGNNKKSAAKWMDLNRPYWSYPGGK